MANAVVGLFIELDSGLTAQSVANEFAIPAAEPFFGLNTTIELLGRVVSGVWNGKVTCFVESETNTTRSTNTITVANHANVTNGDTVTIGGRVLTVAASPANENEWAAGANANADATNLAAVINANSELKDLVSAVASTNTVILTSLMPGRMGNLITVATSDATAFTVVARFSGGASTQSLASRVWQVGPV